jgi:hypothetical protein
LYSEAVAKLKAEMSEMRIKLTEEVQAENAALKASETTKINDEIQQLKKAHSEAV